jgi:Cu/Ag efflux pump CusA
MLRGSFGRGRACLRLVLRQCRLGFGSDVIKIIAVPLIGGIQTSLLSELILYPAIYHWWRVRKDFGTKPEYSDSGLPAPSV